MVDSKAALAAAAPARPMPDSQAFRSPFNALPRFIFMSRWLQVPLYLGLIVAQGVYVWHFMHELMNLLWAVTGSPEAIETIRNNVAVPGADPTSPRR